MAVLQVFVRIVFKLRIMIWSYNDNVVLFMLIDTHELGKRSETQLKAMSKQYQCKLYEVRESKTSLTDKYILCYV